MRNYDLIFVRCVARGIEGLFAGTGVKTGYLFLYRMSPARWQLPSTDPGVAAVARTLEREIGVPAFLADLLARRGFRTPASAYDFLHPKLNLLSDPFALPNMPAAIDRILRALANGERIVLYGDYDVDGVTSLAILSGLLKAYGANAECFLPMRVEEGYGLSAEGVARCVQTLKPQLLIAVDCGTASVREIGALQIAGVDVIVFDHHEAQAQLPDCFALVNPKLGDTYHYLCSAGLVFKVCHALLKRRPLPGFDLKDSLDLVALGHGGRSRAAHGGKPHSGPARLPYGGEFDPSGCARVDGGFRRESPGASRRHRLPARPAPERRGTPRDRTGGARTTDHAGRGPCAHAGDDARSTKPRTPDRRTAHAPRSADAACRALGGVQSAPARRHRRRRAGLASGGAGDRGVAAHALPPSADTGHRVRRQRVGKRQRAQHSRALPGQCARAVCPFARQIRRTRDGGGFDVAGIRFPAVPGRFLPDRALAAQRRTTPGRACTSMPRSRWRSSTPISCPATRRCNPSAWAIRNRFSSRVASLRRANRASSRSGI